MWQHFKKVILAGLFAIAPIALTYWILKITFESLDNFTSPFLRKVNIDIPGLGLLLTLLLIYTLGLFVTNVLGKKLFSWGERILTNIPIVKSIYSTIRQITRTFSGTANQNFQGVVYVEYPRKKLWTLAFVTGTSVNEQKLEFLPSLCSYHTKPHVRYFYHDTKRRYPPCRDDCRRSIKDSYFRGNACSGKS